MQCKWNMYAQVVHRRAGQFCCNEEIRPESSGTFFFFVRLALPWPVGGCSADEFKFIDSSDVLVLNFVFFPFLLLWGTIMCVQCRLNSLWICITWIYRAGFTVALCTPFQARRYFSFILQVQRIIQVHIRKCTEMNGSTIFTFTFFSIGCWTHYFFFQHRRFFVLLFISLFWCYVEKQGFDSMCAAKGWASMNIIQHTRFQLCLIKHN